MRFSPMFIMPLLSLMTSCASYFKSQDIVMLKVDSDVPLDVWNNEEALGGPDEYIRLLKYGSRKFEWYLHVENTVVDTLHLRRRLTPYNRIAASSILVFPLIPAYQLSQVSNPPPFGLAYVAGMIPTSLVVLVDRIFDPYPWGLPSASAVNYTLPKEKSQHYADLIAAAREADRKANERTRVSELTTVDYMPQVLRTKFGLSDVAISAPGINASGQVSQVPTGSTSLTCKVLLKNTSPSPIRVYQSVEKSWVVRGQSTMTIEVPSGAQLFMAKSSRPLVLEAIAVVPNPKEPQLIIDLTQAKASW